MIGFLKGKSAIAIARLCGKERNFSGEHFWARGYAVSTVGFELEQVRQYIREQEERQQRGYIPRLMETYTPSQSIAAQPPNRPQPTAEKAQQREESLQHSIFD